LGGLIIIIFTLGVVYQIVDAMSYEEGYKALFSQQRYAPYVLAVFVLFGVTWLFTTIMSAPVEPGDEIGERMVATDYRPGKAVMSEGQSILVFLRLC